MLGMQVWKDERAALVDRAAFVGGDFFKASTLPKAQPSGRDLYVLRAVVHDWADVQAKQILGNVRGAMGERKDLWLARQKAHDMASRHKGFSCCWSGNTIHERTFCFASPLQLASTQIVCQLCAACSYHRRMTMVEGLSLEVGTRRGRSCSEASRDI